MRILFERAPRLSMGAAVALIAWALSAAGAHAYCVYNKTAWLPIYAEQTGGMRKTGSANQGASGWIAPGKSLCCNWQEGGCNSGGKRDSRVAFHIGYDSVGIVHLCRAKSIEFAAGGWVDVTMDGSGRVRCAAHGP